MEQGGAGAVHECECLNGVLEAKSNKRNETKCKKRKTGVTFERSRQDKVDNEQEAGSTMRHENGSENKWK